jgi:intron-binding protein aquarius
MDQTAEGRPNVYEHINLIVRRKGRENNFLPILESIKRLTLSDIPAPSWLQEVFLGYGDPASATYKRLPNRLNKIDFRDTFLDWQHLIESMPGKSIEPHEEAQTSFGPPYVVEYAAAAEPEIAPPRASKKRRRDQVEVAQPPHESLHVSSYKPPNMGPYPADAPKLNAVRFTPAQIEAITSGTQPGLTVVLGPPGTGKTDVATQIISNIYHNFPDQRTLLVAHSNQALNQLFQKIVALDIDERHLLRLGHGEEDLETDVSYSKHGRVESFLERGQYYLSEVDRLAKNFGAPGAHGSSCETADYFNLVYVKPAWTQYWDNVSSSDTSVEQIITEFPFKDYFSNAPQPLFPPAADREQILEVAQGCYRHVEKIFTELEDIRPFELLRNPRDKANYLLVKEARIIAMTSTHAAMRRQEIANLGFHYDNVIMEEAAQITEIENFIPLALQNPRENKNTGERELPLQRIVLVGDHLQNSPVIQNLAFRQYANLEQSLFQRLVRLGVPTIMLDQQGRARPSIAELYRWRYPSLTNLPSVTSRPEFRTANAGFKHEFQFIDVGEYKGKGEEQPTPHWMVNLGEAEYAVAIFMYMRLLGYPAHKISILTTYAGQRSLINDVLQTRCKGNPLFGRPRHVSTVDKYQGEQNDCEFTLLPFSPPPRLFY